MTKSSITPKNTLRSKLEENPKCKERFKNAETLARSIFTNKKLYVPLPHFTSHGVKHCEKLEEFVNQIIWRDGTLSSNEFDPTPEEAMYLLSAIWLHDIGMMYGILDNESPENSGVLSDNNKTMELRDQHEYRTVKFISKKWEIKCGWEPEEKDFLANICLYHRKKYPITTFDPAVENSFYGYTPCRLAVIASLLRLVDACHVDQSRAPMALMNLYRSVGMSEDHAVHWERAILIAGIEFDHSNREILLRCNCPTKFKFFGGEFDLQEVVDVVRQDIEEELESVKSILLPWSNLFFTTIREKIRNIKAREYNNKEQFLALWPYLLQKPSSSTEATARFVQMLLFALEDDKKWEPQVASMVKKISETRPYDFMITNLCQNITAQISQIQENKEMVSEDAKQVGIIGLRRYLVNFQRSMRVNCDKIIAKAEDMINSGDVLFVFGHSINIENFIRKTHSQLTLYIIDCYQPICKGFAEDENDKIAQIAIDSGCEHEYINFIQLYSFPSILSKLVRGDCNIKLLLGTHGVLQNHDLLCKVGSEILAQIAKKYDVQVFAFSEIAKVASENIDEQDILDPSNLFLSENTSYHPKLGIQYTEPRMDIVSKELVDVLLTEKGDLFEKQSDKASGSKSKHV